MTSLIRDDIDYKVLGFFRHFAFIRFLWSELCSRTEEVKQLRNRLEDLTEAPVLLTGDIRGTDNSTVALISADKSPEDFYKRREGETVEDFIQRIGTTKPKTKTVRSASDLIEEAKKDHIQQFTEVEEKAEEIVSESAINRIGSEIEKVKAKGQ